MKRKLSLCGNSRELRFGISTLRPPEAGLRTGRARSGEERSGVAVSESPREESAGAVAVTSPWLSYRACC